MNEIDKAKEDITLTAYKEGIDAAYRIGKYAGCKDVPNNPFPQNSDSSIAWDEGFVDGTEDLITQLYGPEII